MNPPRNEVWGTCGHCRHTWVIYAPLPAPIEVVAKAMIKAECPSCDTAPKNVLLAKEAEIVKALAGLNPP